MPHIAVIDPGAKVAELHSYNRLSLASPLPTTYHLPAIYGIDSLERIADDIAGIVIFGSGASVHDDEPWQVAMNRWLEPYLQTTPVLGLCYGHQLLAHLLGGEVGFLHEDHDRKERGVRQVPLFEDRLWGEANTGPMVVSHREVVTRLPPNTTLKGASDVCPVEAFSHDTLPLWGFQPHPEATTQFTSNNGIPFDADPEILKHGWSFVDRFTAMAGRSARTPGS